MPENLEDDIKALIEKCKLDGGMPLTQAVAGAGSVAPDLQHDASALTPAATLPISSNENLFVMFLDSKSVFALVND